MHRVILTDQIIAAKHGSLGRHIELATEDTIEIFFKDLYAVQLVYSFSIALTKFSIMAFYRRIFRVPQTKLPLIVLGGVVAAWLMATVRYIRLHRVSILTHKLGLSGNSLLLTNVRFLGQNSAN